MGTGKGLNERCGTKHTFERYGRGSNYQMIMRHWCCVAIIALFILCLRFAVRDKTKTGRYKSTRYTSRCMEQLQVYYQHVAFHFLAQYVVAQCSVEIYKYTLRYLRL